ncbi:MAG: hypothetical protein H7329_09900 [Opitutaceae bacterium]|nr:hypothetical protein [Cytophagales bacterium]
MGIKTSWLYFLIFNFLTLTVAGQFYGEKIDKLKVDKLLILPLNGAYVFVDNKTPTVDANKTKEVNGLLNNFLDSLLSTKMETVRFPLHPVIDSLVHFETLKTAKTIFNNKTVKGMKIPRAVLILMEKMKCDYAVSITYEYWERSEENIRKIKNEKRKQIMISSLGYVAFGLITNHVANSRSKVNTTSYNITESYIIWTIFDKKKNCVNNFFHKSFEQDENYMPQLMRKMYYKCFPSPIIVYDEED